MRKNLFVDIACQVIVKNIKFENVAMVFNLSKKDPATSLALKTMLSFKSFGKYARQIFCVGISLMLNFRSIAYKMCFAENVSFFR